MSDPFIVSAVTFHFVPVAINSNTSAGDSHDIEIINLFGESTWDYPVNWYVDPNVAPGPSNALAPRLYMNQSFAAHVDRMKDALTAYDGGAPALLLEPYITVVKPAKKTTYLPGGTTKVEFEVSPYGSSSGLSYTWHVDGKQQAGDGPTFAHSFSY